MPERVFSYLDVPELKDLAKSLAMALTTGSTTALRNNQTGFLVETGPLSVAQLRRHLMDVRYEIYQRGKAGDTGSALLEPTDPRLEKVMLVEVQRGDSPFWPRWLC